MSILNFFARGIAWNSFGTTLAKIVTLLNVLVIVSRLSVYEYGLAELVFSVIATLSLCTLPGLTQTFVTDASVDKAQGKTGLVKRLLIDQFLLNFLLGFIGWAILFFAAEPIAQHVGNVSLEGFIKIVSFLFLLTPVRTSIMTLVTVLAWFKDQFLYSFLEELAKLALLLTFFYGLERGIDGLLYATVLANLVGIMLYLPRTIRAYRSLGTMAPEGRSHIFRLLSGHRAWSLLSSYVTTIGQSARLWIVNLLFGVEAVGLFAFVLGIFSQLSGLFPFGTVLGQIIGKYLDNQQQLTRLLRSALKYQIYFSVALIFSAWLILPYLIWYLFPKYEAALVLVFVAVLTLIPAGITQISSTFFSAIKAQRSLFYSVVFRMLLTVILFFSLGYYFGLLGISIALVLSSLIAAVERLYRTTHYLSQFSFSPLDLFRVTDEDKAVLAFSIASLGRVWVRVRYWGGKGG